MEPALEKQKSIYVSDFMDAEEAEKATIDKEKGKDEEAFESKKAGFDLKKIMSEFVIKKDIFIAHSTGEIKSRYKFSDKPLGEGAFGVVYLGNERETGAQRAIKVIQRSKI